MEDKNWGFGDVMKVGWEKRRRGEGEGGGGGGEVEME